MPGALGTYFNLFVVRIGILLGFVQGIIWSILSLIAIVWHLSASHDEKITYLDPYQDILKTYLYYTFIKKNAPSTGMYIQPGGFFAVMFIYFFLSVAWTGVSAYVFAAHRNNFGVKKLGIALGVWAGIALATSIVDLVFCSCLGADYNTVLDHYLETEDVVIRLAYTYSTIGYGIVMVLAGRGFVLWIINAILTGIIIKISLDMIYYKVNPVMDDDGFSTCSPRSVVNPRNFPDEARNFRINEIPVRRHTYALPSNDILSSSSVLGPVPGNLNYAFDPEVERRLSRYVQTPSPDLKFRFNK
jgi:hypothetical protein